MALLRDVQNIPTRPTYEVGPRTADILRNIEHHAWWHGFIFGLWAGALTVLVSGGLAWWWAR